ncbi:MAG: response regulator transcription factor [Patescibacteria group bacterium]|nr:response regulator transcription factor [Patescibacteria group bacterium]
MKILLIDDDEALTTIFTAALTKEGFQVMAENTGQEGMDKAKTEAPDLILLDQVLPDYSGNDILKQLKTDDKTKNIPVIILSNFSQDELVKEAINAGAADYVFKYQVEPKDVIEKIKNALSKGQN